MAEATAKFDAGEKSSGHQLMAQAKEARSQMHQLNEKAAFSIFKFNNRGQEDNFLDLRALHPKEAIGFFKERLDALRGTSTELKLIIGDR